MAEGQPAAGNRCRLRDVGRWRESAGGDQRQCRPSARVRETDRRARGRHRGPRRRLHGARGRRVRDRADGQPPDRHAAHRSVPGRHLASPGLSSCAEGAADQVGDNAVSGRAIFLERDGVLNRAIIRDGRPYAPMSVGELEIIPGADHALRRLREAGLCLVVVTNQPDVARGIQTAEGVEAIHAALRAALPIDEFRVCYHHDADACACRKPAPGMLLDAAAASGLSLQDSFLIGDRWRDIEAGRRAGCRTVLVGDGYNEGVALDPRARATSLAEAVDWILMTMRTEQAVAPRVAALKVKIFADGADLPTMVELAALPYVKGFTTNPTLMRKAGVRDYETFAHEALRAIPDRPISFEVFSDEFPQMERQARLISAWGDNVFVKIPVTNSRGEPAYELVRRLSAAGIRVNVTAVFTLDQVRALLPCLSGGA